MHNIRIKHWSFSIKRLESTKKSTLCESCFPAHTATHGFPEQVLRDDSLDKCPRLKRKCQCQDLYFYRIARWLLFVDSQTEEAVENVMLALEDKLLAIYRRPYLPQGSVERSLLLLSHLLEVCPFFFSEPLRPYEVLSIACVFLN